MFGPLGLVPISRNCMDEITLTVCQSLCSFFGTMGLNTTVVRSLSMEMKGLGETNLKNMLSYQILAQQKTAFCKIAYRNSRDTSKSTCLSSQPHLVFESVYLLAVDHPSYFVHRPPTVSQHHAAGRPRLHGNATRVDYHLPSLRIGAPWAWYRSERLAGTWEDMSLVKGNEHTKDHQKPMALVILGL